jgi:Skp family chaperone for outer membrane proteins
MRGLVFGAALTVLAMAAAVEAQTPAAPAAPATQKPAPAQPAPTQPAPAPATPPPAPRPFPEGAKIAYVVLQRIANESAEGKTASTKIQALQTKKAAELNEKNKQLQGLQAEIQELQNQLQQAFQVRIEPVLAQVGQEKGLHLIFNGPDSGLVWADPGLDISSDVIKKLDAIAAGAKPPVK